MAKWLTAFVLLLIMTGSALAGIPMHSGEQGCAMSDMAGMDCCAKAQAQSEAPAASVARLCCALNCSQPGSTNAPANVLRLSPLRAIVLHPATIQPPAAIVNPRFDSDWTQVHPQNSKPTYIRHLALLI